MNIPYIWIAGEADSLALWPVGKPVGSATAAERSATTCGYALDIEVETVEQSGRWCVFVTPTSALQVVGATVYGADYVAPLARVVDVQPRTMRRWLAGTAAPADWIDIFRRLRAGIEPDLCDLLARAGRAELIHAACAPGSIAVAAAGLPSPARTP